MELQVQQGELSGPTTHCQLQTPQEDQDLAGGYYFTLPAGEGKAYLLTTTQLAQAVTDRHSSATENPLCF